MTEEEARTKWCPMARNVVMILESGHQPECTPAHNRIHTKGNRAGGAEGTNESWCIASDCMMWRRELIEMRDGDQGHLYGGYCGLAGEKA